MALWPMSQYLQHSPNLAKLDVLAYSEMLLNVLAPQWCSQCEDVEGINAIVHADFGDGVDGKSHGFSLGVDALIQISSTQQGKEEYDNSGHHELQDQMQHGRFVKNVTAFNGRTFEVF